MALVKGASYKRNTPNKNSSNPRMRAKAKQAAMLKRAAANRASARDDRSAAKAKTQKARKNKTGAFAKAPPHPTSK